MFGCLLLVGSLFAGQAETPVREEFDAEVRRLVRQLDAPALAERDAAEAELVRRGPAALDALPATSDRMSAEVRQRLDRVRQKLQQQAAEAAVESSTVTMKNDRPMPLAKILAEFSRQSGNTIVDQRDKTGDLGAGPLLKVNFDKTPFWPALDRLADQAGLNVYPFAERATIRVTSAPNKIPFLLRVPRVGRASYIGPFRFEPTSVVARRDLRQAGGSLVVNIETAWEPRLKIIALQQRMADVTAVDNRGKTLPVADAEAQVEISTGGDAAAVELNLPFRLPPRDATRIASLRGKLRAMIPGKIETFRFDNLAGAKNVEKRIAGATVTLEQVRKNNKMWEVRMQVRFDDAGDALASHRTWIFNNEAHLEGADGKPIAYDTYDTIRQGKNEVGVAYLFSAEQPLDRLTFVYQTPGTIVNRAFGYELKDIELP